VRPRICKHGHLVDGENAYVRKNGKTECRTCRSSVYASMVDISAGSARRRASRERRKIIIDYLRQGRTPEEIVADTGFTKKVVTYAVIAARASGVIENPAAVKRRPYTAPSHIETWKEFRMRKHKGKLPITKVPWPEYSVHVNDPWQENVPLCRIK